MPTVRFHYLAHFTVSRRMVTVTLNTAVLGINDDGTRLTLAYGTETVTATGVLYPPELGSVGLVVTVTDVAAIPIGCSESVAFVRTEASVEPSKIATRQPS